MMRAAAICAALMAAGSPALAGPASERVFYEDVEGRWSGPGEIVAGKYRGTKFICVLEGDAPGTTPGMEIAGSCQVGMFNQPISAAVRREGDRYVGTFLDGEKGDGMDITGGRYTPSKLMVDIRRKDLRGAMIASLNGRNKLNISIAVRVDDQLVPVINMTLNRANR